MKSNNSNNIFSERSCLAKDKLIQYAKGSLSAKDKHEVESHLVDCILCNEALDGYKLFNGNINTGNLDKDVLNLIKKKNSPGFLRYYAAAAALGTVVLLSYVLVRELRDNKNEFAVKQEVREEPELNEMNVASGLTTEKEIVPQNFISDSLNTADEKLVLQNAEYENKISSQKSNAQAESDMDYVEPVAAASATVLSEMIENSSVLSDSKIPGNITYISNLKVDNSKFNNGNKNAVTFTDNSTPGKYENRVKKQEAAAEDEKAGNTVSNFVDYETKITNGLDLYNSERYQSAIKVFDELLALDASDANANFYKGISTYNLQNFNESIELLSPISNDLKNPFNEEAKYYLALSYESKGSIQKSESLLVEIARGNGFYSKKAIDRLKKIRNEK